MSKATIRDYGKVEFDPMNYDNNVYDLYAIAICDPETDLVVGEEHYTDENDYHDAIRNTFGREFMTESEECGFCDVWYESEQFEAEATYHIAYVIDHEDE